MQAREIGKRSKSEGKEKEHGWEGKKGDWGSLLNVRITKHFKFVQP